MKALKKLIIPVVLLVFFLSITEINWAQEKQSFTLKQAQDYAVEHSVGTKNAQLDIESAKKKVWETTAMGLPQVSANIDYQYILELPESGSDSSFAWLFGTVLGSYGYLNATDPNFTLSSAESLMGMMDDQSGSGSLSFFNEQMLTYGVTVSQLVFSGEYLVGLQASKTYLQLSENLAEKAVLDTKETIATSYFSIKTFESSLEYLAEIRNNLDTALFEMRAIAKQGLIEETDADQIELTIKNIETQFKTLERQKEMMYYLIKIQMGIASEINIELTENLEQLINNYDIDKLTDVQFDINNNIDYKSMETNVKSQELLHKQQMSKYLPQVAAFYKYTGISYLGDEAPSFQTTIPQMVGASVSIPLFSSGQRNARVAQAKIEVEKAKNLQQQTEQNLKMAFMQAKYDVNNALDKYYTAKYSLDLSEKIYKNNKSKFREGMISSMDLTQSNTQYLESLTNYTQATMELLTSKIALNKLVNNL